MQYLYLALLVALSATTMVVVDATTADCQNSLVLTQCEPCDQSLLCCDCEKNSRNRRGN